LEKEDPNLVSLQFVPYAFHKKGLPWNLARQLQKLNDNRKWHIMFHELWVDPSNFKNKLIAFMQRNIIRNLVLKLNPQAMHTSIPIYKQRLENADIYSDILPIFSNITGTSHHLNGYSRPFTMVFFSQFKIRESIIQFLGEFIFELQMNQMDFKILLIGEEKPAGLKLRETLNKIPGTENKIHFTGFLDEPSLYKVIDCSNLGITPVPRHLLGKSGSVAAFLSQGIPIAAPYVKPGYEGTAIGFYNTDISRAILSTPNLSAYKTCENAAMETAKELSVAKITDSLLEDLGMQKVTKPLQMSKSVSSN